MKWYYDDEELQVYTVFGEVAPSSGGKTTNGRPVGIVYFYFTGFFFLLFLQL